MSTDDVIENTETPEEEAALDAEFAELISGKEPVADEDEVNEDEEELGEEELDSGDEDDSDDENDDAGEEVEEEKEKEKEKEEVEPVEEDSEEDTDDAELKKRQEEFDAEDENHARFEAQYGNNDLPVNFEDFSTDDGLIDLSKLPDIDIGEGEDKVNLRAFAKEYPSMMNVFNVLLGAVTKKAVGSTSGRLQDQLNTISYRNRIDDVAPGAYSHVTSKAFKTWVDKQNPTVRRMASSDKFEDSAVVIKRYMTEFNGADEKPAAKEKKKAKKKKDKLLSSNLRGKKSKKSQSLIEIDVDSLSEVDLDAEWDKLTK